MKVYIGPYTKKKIIRVRIDDYDVWSLDYTLALIITPALKYYRKYHHGSPHMKEFFDEKTGKTLPGLHKKWDEIIDKMVWSFEAILRDDDLEQKNHKKYTERIEEGLRLFAEYFRALWD